MILTDHMCLRVIIFWMSLSMLVDVAEPLVGMMLAPMCAGGISWGKPRSKCIGHHRARCAACARSSFLEPKPRPMLWPDTATVRFQLESA